MARRELDILGEVPPTDHSNLEGVLAEWYACFIEGDLPDACYDGNGLLAAAIEYIVWLKKSRKP